MKQGSTIFLRIAISLIALVVLGICIFLLPLLIGSPEAGHYRPILFGLYITAVPFFIALYQTMKLIGYIDKNIPFSDLSVRALTNIKYCALIISVLFTASLPYTYFAASQDDAPGVVLIGLIIIFASGVIATASGVLAKLVKSAIDIKAENDLTV